MSKSLNTEMTSVPKSDSEFWVKSYKIILWIFLLPLVKSCNQAIISYKVYTYLDWII